MSIEIVLGWWLAPTAVTLAGFGWALLTPPETSGGGWWSYDIMPLFRFIAALIASLASWLIWAVLT